MTFPLAGFDAVHASPPCQGYSRMRHLPWLKGRKYPLLLDACRERLVASGLPWVIENVEDAPLKGVRLCGLMFGLKVYRHRLFECSHFLWQPEHPKHPEVIGRGRMLNDRAGVSENGFVSLPSKVPAGKPDRLSRYYHADGSDGPVSVGGHNFRMDAASVAMGIDWMKRKELAQAIPPAFTEYVGKPLCRIVESSCA